MMFFAVFFVCAALGPAALIYFAVSLIRLLLARRANRTEPGRFDETALLVRRRHVTISGVMLLAVAAVFAVWLWIFSLALAHM